MSGMHIPAALQLDFEAFFAVAIYSYQPEDKGEVGFQEGQVMKIVGENEFGWWLSQSAKGDLGWVPSNFFQRVEQDTVNTEEFKPEPETYQSKKPAQDADTPPEEQPTVTMHKASSAKKEKESTDISKRKASRGTPTAETTEKKESAMEADTQSSKPWNEKVEIGLKLTTKNIAERSLSRSAPVDDEDEMKPPASPVLKNIPESKPLDPKEEERRRLIEERAAVRAAAAAENEKNISASEKKMELQRRTSSRSILGKHKKADKDSSIDIVSRSRLSSQDTRDLPEPVNVVPPEDSKQKESKQTISKESISSKFSHDNQASPSPPEIASTKASPSPPEIASTKASSSTPEIASTKASPSPAQITSTKASLSAAAPQKSSDAPRSKPATKSPKKDPPRETPPVSANEVESKPRSSKLSTNHAPSRALSNSTPTPVQRPSEVKSDPSLPSCVVCSKNLSGIQVKVDNVGMIHLGCLKCSICHKNIAEENPDNPNVHGGKLFCTEHFHSITAASCAKCHEDFNSGQLIRAMGKSWHRECFVCGFCGGIFKDNKYHRVADQNLPVCAECFKVKFAPTCATCKKPISEGVSIKVLSKCFHQDCFICPIGSHPLSTSGPLKQVNGILCCAEHVNDLLLKLETHGTL